MRSNRWLLACVLLTAVACGGGVVEEEPAAVPLPEPGAVAGRGDPDVDRVLSERLRDLERLGEIRADPRGEEEQRAAQIVERAAAAARRGEYPRALELLEQAERVAPDYLPIYPIRANVAYLTGAVDVAIAALERGLEIDPSNMLVRENLERLEAEPLRIGRRP